MESEILQKTEESMEEMREEKEKAGGEATETLPKVPAGLLGCHPVSLGHLPALSRRPPEHTTQKHREQECKNLTTLGE